MSDKNDELEKVEAGQFPFQVVVSPESKKEGFGMTLLKTAAASAVTAGVTAAVVIGIAEAGRALGLGSCGGGSCNMSDAVLTIG